MSIRYVTIMLLALCSLAGCGGPPAQPDILVVVLDTVRDDATAVGGDATGLTPALAEFADDATVFTHAWATAPWTVPSHASMFTGHLSSAHGCNHAGPRLAGTWPTAAQLLSGAGYATAAFFSNPWLADRTTYLLRGFDLRRESPVGDPARVARYRGDQGGRGTLENFRRWFERRDRDRPFFAFVNFLEAHHPFDPPREVRRERLGHIPADEQVSNEWIMAHQAGLHVPGEVDWGRVRDLYDGDVNATDRLLAELLAMLEEDGALSSTVVIVTSDHGELIGERELVSHQFSVLEPLLAVPMVVRAPGRLDAGERDDPVLLTDLFATLCDLGGVVDAPARSTSRSLFGPPASADRPLIAEYMRPDPTLLRSLEMINPDLDRSVLDRGFRTLRIGDLRLTLADGGDDELHDLTADPDQRRNLAAGRGRDVRALRSLLDSYLSAPPERTTPVELDEATREQLRSLGYVH